jgi:meckelin
VLNKAVHNFAGWIDGFPWTAYENKARDELFTTDINRVVSLRGGSSVMSMTLSKYAMDGTFLGFESLKTQLTLCRGDERVLASYQRFGSNVRRECTVDLRQLIADPSEPVFYELWIDDPVDRAGKERAEGTALYPVPVIIANYGSPPDDAPNQFLARNLNIDLTFASPELEKVVLHRRFFLVDAVSGRKSRGATADREDPSLQVVRWAKSVILRVSLQIDDPDTPFDESLRILPPYVVIEYEQQQTSIIPEEDLGFGAENEALRYAPVSFVSQYTMNLEYYWRVMFILMFVMIGLVIIDFGVKISVRTQSKAMDPIGIAADLFGSVAGVFFWSLWFFAAYWFFFFKLQSEPKTLMPLENPHHDYLTLVIIAISCKVLNVIFLVYRQCCVDIFFIDWEKEKAPDDGIVKEKAGELPNVSVWRYILIANEWCEMQCNRHTDVDFTLMFCLLFLAGLKFEHLATQQPSATDLTPGEPNMVVRFFVISMFYFTVVLIQLLYKALTYRFERDPLDHFADLCNLANISTFILDEELHGYYIHGRAVHPHCDVNMQKMQANLAAEAEGNLPFRGLTQKGEADLQGASDSVFELYVTNDIRDKYSQHVEGALRGGGKKSGARVDQQAAAQHSINEFLGHHVIDDLAQNASDVVILPSIAHKLTGAPPSRKSESAVLIRDSANLYSRVLLYGIEYDLILFDLLVFVAWSAPCPIIPTCDLPDD